MVIKSDRTTEFLIKVFMHPWIFDDRFGYQLVCWNSTPRTSLGFDGTLSLIPVLHLTLALPSPLVTALRSIPSNWWWKAEFCTTMNFWSSGVASGIVMRMGGILTLGDDDDGNFEWWQQQVANDSDSWDSFRLQIGVAQCDSAALFVFCCCSLRFRWWEPIVSVVEARYHFRL